MSVVMRCALSRRLVEGAKGAMGIPKLLCNPGGALLLYAGSQGGTASAL